MRGDIARVLIDRDAIATRVAQLGARIAADLDRLAAPLAPSPQAVTTASAGRAAHDAHDARELVLVPILTGSMVFVADLIRELPRRLRIGVVSVSSYPGASLESKGAMIRGALPAELRGKHVLVVDDILDSGATLRLVTGIVAEQRPASVRTCVLLRKPWLANADSAATPAATAPPTAASHRCHDDARPPEATHPADPRPHVDYVGFDIPNEFVVGYGLDYDDYYRNLPDIVTLRPEALCA